LFVGDSKNVYVGKEHCNFVADFCIRELFAQPRKRDAKWESKLESMMKQTVM